MAELDDFYDACLELTKRAAQVIKDAFGKSKNVEWKSSDIDLVTETDKQVEKLLIGGLQERFPDHKFIGEESTESGVKCDLTDDPTWIIDPVDGTTNFVHGFPFTAISIALLIKKEPVIGMIHAPILEQVYTARIGQGAFLNGQRLKVSGQTEMSRALVCAEVGTSKDSKKVQVVLNNMSKLIGNVHGIRSLGSAALNMASVANGGADAYFEFGIHAWDMAAGDLIVREAGGVVIDTQGGSFDVMNRRVLCASSEALAKTLSQTLDQIELERD